MSIEVLPHFISYPLGNYIQFVKPLNVSKEQKCHDYSYTSPRVTVKDSGIWDDTLGEKCHRRHRPNSDHGTYDKLHEIFLAHLDGSNTERVHPNIGIFQGNLVTHLNGDNMEEVYCNSDELQRFPVIHFGGDNNMEEVHCNSD